MQRFSADAIIFSNFIFLFFWAMKTWKKRPQKLLIIGPNFFLKYWPGCQNQPRIDFSCYKYVPRPICLLICDLHPYNFFICICIAPLNFEDLLVVCTRSFIFTSPVHCLSSWNSWYIFLARTFERMHEKCCKTCKAALFLVSNNEQNSICTNVLLKCSENAGAWK